MPENKTPRTEPVFSATYNFDEAAPRVADHVVLTIPASPVRPNEMTLDLDLITNEKARRFHDYLASLGAQVAYKVETYDSLEPGFKARLKALYASINIEDHRYTVTTTPRIETPVRAGQEAHRTKRRALERFLKSEGIGFTVECATLHSDMVCNLAEDGPAGSDPNEKFRQKCVTCGREFFLVEYAGGEARSCCPNPMTASEAGKV